MTTRQSRYIFRYTATTVLLWLCITSAYATAVQETKIPNHQASDFEQLALNLNNTPRSLRVDFAIAAIAETIALHKKETRNTGAQPTSGKHAAWRKSVDDYTRQLEAIGRSITANTSVRIYRGTDSRIQLQLNGQVAIISSPRVNQQALLEQTITEHFCSQYPCDSLIDNYASAGSSAIKTLPHWQFQLSPVPSCNSGNGLELLFANNDKLIEKRDFCKQLFGEFSHLLGAIAERQKAGVAIDWYQLEISSPSYSRLNRVRLNSEGDSLELAIPASARCPELIKRITPWLLSRASGDNYRDILLVVTNTEQLIDMQLPDTLE
jgi:hypothetical protein